MAIRCPMGLRGLMAPPGRGSALPGGDEDVVDIQLHLEPRIDFADECGPRLSGESPASAPAAPNARAAATAARERVTMRF